MNIKDVENLAELAKIELSENEKKAILKDMEGILAYVKVIEEVKVDDVMPVYSQKNIWREDKFRYPVSDSSVAANLPAGCVSIFGYSTTTNQRCDGTTDLRIQFPDAQDGFLKVKKIL